LTALQSTVVIMGLPFSMVLFFMMAGLYKALKVEGYKEDSHRASLAGYLSSRTAGGERAPRNWRKRLTRAMSFPSHKQARRFLDEIGKPAMEEVSQELSQQGVSVGVHEGEGEREHLALNVSLGSEQDFTYQIWPRKFATPSFAIRAQQSNAHYYRLEVHLLEGSQGYDLMGYTTEQVIEDILDQYERHLHFLHVSREAAGHADMPDDPYQPAS
ncbi:MAG TPA: high-affinity choline transporter BetT, partial [Modicisalibacter sp.]|nr:high-affinity choline transporter BetT [Modicisalibacter sp.]